MRTNKLVKILYEVIKYKRNKNIKRVNKHKHNEYITILLNINVMNT